MQLVTGKFVMTSKSGSILSAIRLLKWTAIFSKLKFLKLKVWVCQNIITWVELSCYKPVSIYSVMKCMLYLSSLCPCKQESFLHCPWEPMLIQTTASLFYHLVSFIRYFFVATWFHFGHHFLFYFLLRFNIAECPTILIWVEVFPFCLGIPAQPQSGHRTCTLSDFKIF